MGVKDKPPQRRPWKRQRTEEDDAHWLSDAHKNYNFQFLVVPSFIMETALKIGLSILSPKRGCKIDLKDAYFHVPIAWEFQPGLQVGREDLRLSVPPLRLSSSTVGFYQGNKTGQELATQTPFSSTGLLGRLPSSSRHPGEIKSSHIRGPVPFQESRIPDNHKRSLQPSLLREWIIWEGCSCWTLYNWHSQRRKY